MIADTNHLLELPSFHSAKINPNLDCPCISLVHLSHIFNRIGVSPKQPARSAILVQPWDKFPSSWRLLCRWHRYSKFTNSSNISEKQVKICPDRFVITSRGANFARHALIVKRLLHMFWQKGNNRPSLRRTYPSLSTATAPSAHQCI